jgi:hypothetical protein
MSRRRDLSTDISVDKKLKRLSDFAALLYTWMIPHAGDDCRLGAKDPEEINLLVVPNRRKTDDEVAAALDELFDADLIGQDESGHYFLPSTSFYKYQNKIALERRAVTPKPGRTQLTLPLTSAEISPQNPAKPRKTPQNPVLSSSLSSSFSLIGCAIAPPLRARESRNNDLGLGDRHPATLCTWELWDRLEKFWQSQGKKMTIFQVEMAFKLLSDAKHKGHDPIKIVEKTLRAGWMDLYEPEKEPQKPIAAPIKPAAIKSPQPKPLPEEIAKAKQFLAELVVPLAQRKAMPARDIEERRALLRRQAAQLRGGP